MNKKITKYTIFFLSILNYSTAQSQETSPIYLELGTGITFNSGQESSSLSFNSYDKKFKNKSAIPLSSSIGYKYSPNLRWDINITYLPDWNIDLSGNNSLSHPASLKTSMSSLSTSLNGYYDFTNLAIENTIPYITAGIGVNINKINNADYFIDKNFIGKYSAGKTNNFLWKIGLGARHKINDSLLLNLSYKFVNLGKVRSNTGYMVQHSLNNEDDEYSSIAFPNLQENISIKNLYSHQIMLSVNFSF